MSFSAAWLALREPYDRAARNGAVLDAVAAMFADTATVTVTDLGSGTGATLRTMAPRLRAQQNWRLIDNDATLLKMTTPTEAGARVNAFVTDLAANIENVFGYEDLVTTSALLDLVSAAWLNRLIGSLVRLSLPFYAALSYDGDVELAPETWRDPVVIAAVNRHQRIDKGFGPALGPDAARTAARCLRDVGYTIVEGRSDWRLGTDDRCIQMEMLAGWARAAREIGVGPELVGAWLDERRDHVTAGRSQMRVGHIDVFATPTGRR